MKPSHQHQTSKQTKSKQSPIKILFCLLVLMLSLTGCAKSTVELKINGDGSGEYTVKLGVDSYIANDRGLLNRDNIVHSTRRNSSPSYIQQNLRLNDNNVYTLLNEYIVSDKYLTYKTGIEIVGGRTYETVEASFKFKDLPEMQRKLNTTYGVYAEYYGDRNAQPRSNIINGIKSTGENLKYKVYLNIPKDDITTEKFDVRFPIENMDFDFKLILPDNARVLSSNSNHNIGNTYTWKVNDSLQSIKLDYEMDLMWGDVPLKVFIVYIPAGISVLVGIVYTWFIWAYYKTDIE